MIFDAGQFARVRYFVSCICAAAWLLIFEAPDHGFELPVCHPRTSGAPFGVWISPFLTMHQAQLLTAGWALMLIAMMAPVLVAPIYSIRSRSFKHRRSRATALFLGGYALAWMPIGAVAAAIELAATQLAPRSYLPSMVAALLAVLWQCSPTKQRCLNRCFVHRESHAFGIGADADALRFGLTHGVWCAGSCMPLMLLAMLLPRCNQIAMVAVAILIFSERLERPGAACWRWRGLGKSFRLVSAQARLGWRAFRGARAPDAFDYARR